MIVDDLMATGGTNEAMIKLVEALGGEVAGVLVLIELAGLKGIEYTTFDGHMLCLGTDKIIDFVDISNIDCTVKDFRANGGLIGIAHPFQIGTPICTGGHWDYKITKWENVN